MYEKSNLGDEMQPAWHGEKSSRRRIRLKIIATLLLLPFFILLTLWRNLPASAFKSCGHEFTSEDLLQNARLIDGHNDWAIWIRAFYDNHIYNSNFTENATLSGQVDIARLAKGGLRGQFWSIYVECPTRADVNNQSDYLQAVSETLQQADLVNRLVERFPSRLMLATDTAAFDAEPLSSGRLAGFLGVEGLHQIGNSAATLRLYHKLGVRYATLTHTCHNKYADSEEPAPLHHGLSDAGRQIVREMNRLGMAVDLAHVSADTMRDVLRITRAPVMFSHSGAKGAFNHTRNVPDDVLDSVRLNGGIVMVPFYPAYLVSGGKGANLSHVVEHMLYIRQRIGHEHVGIGSDFDGMPQGPEGLEDVSTYPALIQALIDRGLPRGEIMAIMGGNVLRVMRGVEEAGLKLSGQLPLEDDLPPFFDRLGPESDR